MGHMRRNVIEAGLESPLDAAIAQRDRGVLSMVRRALERGDAVLAYQPVMRADGKGAAFYEGLIRILDETGRVIPAREFIREVEDQDLGRQIDCAALRIGLNMLKANPSLTLSINMSARSIGYPGWMQILRRVVRHRPEAVSRLILEMREDSVMQIPEIAAAFMAESQEKGVTFALDNFGAGTTMFRHLRHLPFDILKLDGQFTRDVDKDADNQVIMLALIAMARELDVMVTAEAVETGAEAAWLAAAGIDCLQGYYFGAPSVTPPWRPKTTRAHR